MNLKVDISDTGHPECKEQLIEEVKELGSDETLIVVSDHDPEQVLQQYETEKTSTIDWSYREDGPEEWKLSVTKEGNEKKEASKEFDARKLPPSERHEIILQSYQELDVGQSLLLINDHDPKPLFYELGSIHGDTFNWEYVKREKQEYRVKITKTDESKETPEEASTRVDVRVIPPSDRHQAIFHRFDLLAADDAMEIVADHDPEPLRHQLREVHGEETFEWNYLQKNPGEVRVLLRKKESSSDRDKRDEQSQSNVNEETIEEAPELDVRSNKPRKRHDLVFERYQSLDAGEAFILVNDHDPKPLYYQMKQEMEGNLHWEYLKQEEDEWKVLIGKK